MKDQNYFIRIPEPCHEDWNSMQPDPKGKFCGSCNKSVFDFSDKTDADIYDILMTNKGRKICGHFKKTQVDRPLRLTVDPNQFPKNISRMNAFAIAVFVVFGSFLFSCTDHHDKIVGKMEIVVDSTTRTAENFNLMKGDTILDTLPVKDPDIKLPDRENHIAGGLSFVPGPELTGEVEAVDTIQVVGPDQEPPLTGLIVVQRPEIEHLAKELKIDSMANKNPEPVAVSNKGTLLNVYPNPGKGEFTLVYDVIKRTNIRIDVFDLQGAWLKTIVNISNQHEGKYKIPFDLNGLSDGVYLLNMINGGERSTAKIILAR